MVTIVRDRIQDMVKRNLTLEQVKAAKPTLDYDTRYGRERPFIVEAVYDSLQKRTAETAEDDACSYGETIVKHALLRWIVIAATTVTYRGSRAARSAAASTHGQGCPRQSISRATGCR